MKACPQRSRFNRGSGARPCASSHHRTSLLQDPTCSCTISWCPPQSYKELQVWHQRNYRLQLCNKGDVSDITCIRRTNFPHGKVHIRCHAREFRACTARMNLIGERTRHPWLLLSYPMDGFIHFELSRLTSNDHATSQRIDVLPPASHGRNPSRLLLRASSRHARCSDVQRERECGERSEGEEGDGPGRIGGARGKSNESQTPADNLCTQAMSRSEIRERRSRAFDARACRNCPRRSSA